MWPDPDPPQTQIAPVKGWTFVVALSLAALVIISICGICTWGFVALMGQLHAQ